MEKHFRELKRKRKNLQRILTEFPWLWATCNSWGPEKSIVYIENENSHLEGVLTNPCRYYNPDGFETFQVWIKVVDEHDNTAVIRVKKGKGTDRWAIRILESIGESMLFDSPTSIQNICLMDKTDYESIFHVYRPPKSEKRFNEYLAKMTS